MKQSWLGSTGVSATTNNLLAMVDSFAFISMYSVREYMPPFELVVGLVLSASLGLGSDSCHGRVIRNQQ